MSRLDKYQAIENLAEDVLGLMEDLYQSGFDTVHDSTLQGMERAAKRTTQYGMRHLSELLGQLAAEISESRHQMKKKTAQMAELYTQINEYLYICRQKTAYDRGLAYYTIRTEPDVPGMEDTYV